MAVQNYPHLVKTGIVNAIKALALDGIGDKVYPQLWRDETGIKSLPAIVVTNEYTAPVQQGGDSLYDGWDFPNRVYICDSNAYTDHSKQETFFDQWMKIVNAFHFKRLEGETCVQNMRVVTSPIVDPKLREYQKIVQALEIWAWVLVPRN